MGNANIDIKIYKVRKSMPHLYFDIISCKQDENLNLQKKNMNLIILSNIIAILGDENAENDLKY